ncbi:leucine-rich repeat-containing protein 74B-like [Montipora capricornis]|uniref:leucine-rich repeat-containing protein 74B-like n=1 Tax=Montipora capricornis TaxID=246305 RepID=UPI0035F15381
MSTKYPVRVDSIRQVPHSSPEEEKEVTEEPQNPEKPTPSSDEEYDTDLENDVAEDDSEETENQGKIRYLTACKNLGLIPCTPFLRQLEKSEMNLMHYNLGPVGAEAVAVALMNNNSIMTLNLSDNCIGADGAIYIAKMLTENPFITELDVSHNELRLQGAYAMSEMLRDNSELLELNLSNNGFEQKGAEPIVEALKHNYTLKSLNLSHNNFCELGGQLLGPAIDANVGLECLDLSWNHLRRKGAVAIGYGLGTNFALKFVDLSWNGFADDGAKSVGDALRENNTLTELDISSNRISVIGAKWIANGLARNSTLQILRVGQNPFQTEGAYQILSAVAKNKESAIEELSFDDIPVNVEFEDLLEDVLDERPNLSVQCGKAMKGKDRVKIMKDKVDVLNLLLQYIELRGLRVVDFFRQLDKDNNKKISKEEFIKGVKKIGIPMTRKQLKKLTRILDTDNDGFIDYREMVAIKKDDVFDFYHKKKMYKKDDPQLQSFKSAQQKKTP